MVKTIVKMDPMKEIVRELPRSHANLMSLLAKRLINAFHHLGFATMNM